ncbi:MAG: fold metallo-hydrolase [Herbinix sp.]|jgi:phosphoribosyl 1,2-cyclic phosphodiesterase|nr:fold metallo-hydrolase [Herbinix sp.]
MKLRCLGSNSLGNCYLLESETECLVLEAGIPFISVKKALNFNISKIVGILITHEHGDHAKYVKDYVNAGIEARMSLGTAENIDADHLTITLIREGEWRRIGGYVVTPFPVVHDAAEPMGFIIRHQDIGTLLFATDTEYIKQNFAKLKANHILIECNYSQKIIDGRMHQGETVKGLRDRIIQSHMELETCKSFIEVNKTSSLDNVVLLHLSDGNSNEKIFREEIQAIIGPRVKVVVADKGVTVDLDIMPFC